MTDVFISYSRKDIAFARLLHEALVENELETWIDWQDIPPSADWLAEVYEAIEAADAFVFIISETSLASEVCGLEIAHAAKHNKRLIPIVIHDVEAEQVPKELSVLNWIFFDDAGEKFAEAMDDLVTAITVDQAWVKGHTRFENRALDWERKERDRGLLLRGADLSEAESWLAGAAGKDPQPTALQTEFILKSREDATRRQRMTLIGVGVGLVIAVGLGILAWTQRNVAVSEGLARATAQAEAVAEAEMRATAQVQAEEQRNIALEQRDIAEQQKVVAEARQLAALSQTYVESDLDLAILLSIEGHQRDPNYLTLGSLLAALQEDPYLLRQFHFQLGITDLEFHPSDNYIAIASSYNIYFWDQVNNEQAFNPIINHTRPVTDIAINKDGSILASASQDGTLKLWDLENGRKLIATLLENDITNYVKHIAFSPDDSMLAALTSNEIWVWNTSSLDVISKNGRPLSVDTNNGLIVNKNLVINKNNEIFFLRGDQLEVWDYKTGERIAQLPGDNIDSIEISPNAEQVAGINEDEPRISIWDSATYELVNDIRITPTTYDYTSTQIKFHPQRNLLFLINNQVLQYLNLENPDQLVTLKTLPESTQRSPQNVLAFSKDGRSLIYGGKEGIVNLRSVYRTDSENDPFYGYKSIGDGLSLSPDETALVATGINENEELIIHIWGFPDLTYTGSINLGQGDTRWDDKYKTLFLPNGNLVFSGIDEEIRFYDPDNLSRIDKQLQIGDEVRSIALSPDGSLLAVLKGYPAGVDIWEVQSGELLGEIVLNEENRLSKHHIGCIAISPDNKILAAGLSGGLGSASNLITFWDLETVSLIGDPLIGPSSPSGLNGMNDLEYSHDGTMLASSDDQGTTLLWDVQTRFSIGAPMSGISKDVTRVLFSQDDSILFTGSSAGEITLWDVQTQQPIGLPISGVSARQLAADLPNFNAFHGRYGHTDLITNIILGSDDRYLVTMDKKGKLGIWDFDIDSWYEKACLKAGRNFTQDEWGLYFPDEPYRATCPQFADSSVRSEIDLSAFTTHIREIDDMLQVFVPAGEFEYGSSTWTDDGGVFRIIDVDAFWIDQTEVSNAQYQICVAAGGCTPPASNSSETRTGRYYGSETYADYPVVFVSFGQAEEYCKWVGGRLPLETEWEKAARGTSGYDYPWGNFPPEPDYVNFHYLNPDTVSVESYPAGSSPYGVLNMAGNVREWAYDYPMEGESDLPQIIRGGAYDTTYVFTWMVESSFEGFYWNDIGFRCVNDE